MSCIKVYFNNITNIWGLQWPKKATKQRAIAKDITLISILCLNSRTFVWFVQEGVPGSVAPVNSPFGKSTIQYLGGQNPDNSNRRWFSVAGRLDCTRVSLEIFSEIDKSILTWQNGF